MTGIARIDGVWPSITVGGMYLFIPKISVDWIHRLSETHQTELAHITTIWLNWNILNILLVGTLIMLVLSLVLLLLTYRKQKDQRDLVQSLNKNAEALSVQNNSIHRFIGIVSHDLRSPLNTISAISEILAMDADQLPPNEIEEYAGTIHDLTLRINHLVNNMMDANKIEIGDVKLEPKPISVADVLADVHKNLQLLGEKKSITTSLHIDKNLPLAIADTEGLTRVVENLVNNAYKFSKPGSQVSIIAKNLLEQDKVQIVIKDEGPGFTETDKANLYQKFTKLSAKPTNGEKTSGLGLFIVFNLIKQMMGSIDLQSKVGEGSAFFITLDTES